MSFKTTLMVIVAASLVAATGCKKNDPTANAGPDQSAATPVQAPSAAAPAGSAVATYPTQVNMGSITRQTLQSFPVHQAADDNSPTIGHVSVGTWINIKASYSNWYMIEYPIGVGQLGPGWIEFRGGVSDPRLNQVVATPTATTTTTTAVVPPATTTTTALPARPATTATGRPTIVLKPRH